MLTTMVSGPSSGASWGASTGRLCDFTPSKTTSAGPMVCRLSDTFGMRLQLILGFHDAHSAFQHGAQMRAAREQRDVFAGSRHFAAHIGADGSRPRHHESHHCALDSSVAATFSRWILPVAVRGMAVTMWICLGHLNSASRPLHHAIDVGCAGALAHHHRRGHFFAPRGVRHAEAHRLRHCRMRQQHLVDLPRRDLLTAAVDQLLEPARERQIAVRVQTGLDRRCETIRRKTTWRWPRDCSRTRESRWDPGCRPRPAPPAGTALPCSSRMAMRTPVPGPTEPGLRAAGGSGFEDIWCDASVMP